MGDDVLSQAERLLGSPVRRLASAPWGSKNRTSIVELADGREVVLQQYADRDTAAMRLRAATQLARPLNDHGVRVPLVVIADLSASDPWAIFERLPGEPGYVAADHDLSGESFPAIATDMGVLLRRMAALDPADFDLPRLWADPHALGEAAREWLAALKPHLSAPDESATRQILDRVPELFAARSSVVCHGDFGPQNVLVVGGRVSGLLDLEDVRIGDPLLDASWWAWLVRAHTPAAFTATWSDFLSAARIDPSADAFDERVIALVIVRLLETADTYRRSAPEKYPSWAVRLSKTLEWRGGPLS